ncbi:hypothetical protein BDN70DRAFT_983951 [Pholiota conissans]|uniref:Uncharacterized protein n=1 Tax=Pholiota conissans TaxID=109636 RepID=A0A9P5YKK9_9AGAR|nr:hypothetical protein BDN70DRAFT_983951 [Pholiota conissans]
MKMSAVERRVGLGGHKPGMARALLILEMVDIEQLVVVEECMQSSTRKRMSRSESKTENDDISIDVDDDVPAIHFLTATATSKHFLSSSVPFSILSHVRPSNHTSFKTKRTPPSNSTRTSQGLFLLHTHALFASSTDAQLGLRRHQHLLRINSSFPSLQ